MIVRDIVYSSQDIPTTRKLSGSHVLYQEWAAIRTILHLPDEEQKGPPEIDTEPTIELLCFVVAGNGLRVCHRVD